MFENDIMFLLSHISPFCLSLSISFSTFMPATVQMQLLAVEFVSVENNVIVPFAV